jgi:hypothetical protein
VKWAVYRWISPISGTIKISGTLKKLGTVMGDGVTGYVFINNVKKWSQPVAYNDGVGYSFSMIVSVAVGAIVDFALSPNSNEYGDWSSFNASIFK